MAASASAPRVSSSSTVPATAPRAIMSNTFLASATVAPLKILTSHSNCRATNAIREPGTRWSPFSELTETECLQTGSGVMSRAKQRTGWTDVIPPEYSGCRKVVTRLGKSPDFGSNDLRASHAARVRPKTVRRRRSSAELVAIRFLEEFDHFLPGFCLFEKVAEILIAQMAGNGFQRPEVVSGPVGG